MAALASAAHCASGKSKPTSAEGSECQKDHHKCTRRAENPGRKEKVRPLYDQQLGLKGPKGVVGLEATARGWDMDLPSQLGPQRNGFPKEKELLSETQSPMRKRGESPWLLPTPSVWLYLLLAQHSCQPGAKEA